MDYLEILPELISAIAFAVTAWAAWRGVKFGSIASSIDWLKKFQSVHQNWLRILVLCALLFRRSRLKKARKPDLNWSGKG